MKSNIELKNRNNNHAIVLHSKVPEYIEGLYPILEYLTRKINLIKINLESTFFLLSHKLIVPEGKTGDTSKMRVKRHRPVVYGFMYSVANILHS